MNGYHIQLVIQNEQGEIMEHTHTVDIEAVSDVEAIWIAKHCVHAPELASAWDTATHAVLVDETGDTRLWSQEAHRHFAQPTLVNPTTQQTEHPISKTKDEIQTELKELFANEGVYGRIKNDRLLLTIDRLQPLSLDESIKLAEWCALYGGNYQQHGGDVPHRLPYEISLEIPGSHVRNQTPLESALAKMQSLTPEEHDALHAYESDQGVLE
jgi:hypothetical protein